MPFNLVVNGAGVRPQHINQRNGIPLCIRTNGFLQRNVALSLLAGTQAHEDFISYRRPIVTAASGRFHLRFAAA